MQLLKSNCVVVLVMNYNFWIIIIVLTVINCLFYFTTLSSYTKYEVQIIVNATRQLLAYEGLTQRNNTSIDHAQTLRGNGTKVSKYLYS